MAPDDRPDGTGPGGNVPGDGDAELLDTLAVLVALEGEMPESVPAAAKALHDWSRVDAELAEMVELEVSATRHGAAPLAWRTARLEVQVEVSAQGWQRRRLEGEVEVPDPAGAGAVTTVDAQLNDGTIHPATVDGLGGFEVDVPAGSVRLVVRHGGHAMVTPWFPV